jgi:Ulp1 family protease
MSILTNYNGSLDVGTQELESILPNCWLNDTIIRFWLSFLEGGEKLLLKETENPDSSFVFVDPSVAGIIKFADDVDEIRECGVGLGLVENYPEAPTTNSACKHVLVPVNNCTSLYATGASHWSLLYIDLVARRAVHLDSIDGETNTPAASDMTRCFAKMLDWEPIIVSIAPGCPKQINCHDCGVYVCLLAQHIYRTIVEHEQAVDATFNPKDDPLQQTALTAAVTPSQCLAWRTSTTNLILSLAKQQQD